MDNLSVVPKREREDIPLEKILEIENMILKNQLENKGGQTLFTPTEQRVNLFFACDDNYIPFLAVTLNSIVKKISPSEFYRAIVLHANNICASNQVRIISSFTRPNFEIKFHDITNEVEDFASKLHTRDYYSKATYYRLFIPNLYPNIDKALYLDCDIVLLDDVAKLFHTDLGDNLVGATHDGAVETVKPFQDYVVNTIGVDRQEDYFNAGVLLMNTKKMREINFENKFCSLLSQVVFDVAQDQDYLNAICRNKVKRLDYAWDVMPFENLRLDVSEIKLIHYNLSFKPWHRSGVLYEDIFWDLAQDVDYYEEILNIKRNYPQELIELAEKQTQNLIQSTVVQSQDVHRNERIRKIIIKIMDE